MLEQSWSVPTVQLPVIVVQVGRHCLSPPAVALSEQVVPTVQVSLAQQGCPTPPQVVQLPPEQMVSLAVHLSPVQQGWPAWPQAGGGGAQTWVAVWQFSPEMQMRHSTVPPHWSGTFPQRLPAPLPHSIARGVQGPPSPPRPAASDGLPPLPPLPLLPPLSLLPPVAGS